LPVGHHCHHSHSLLTPSFSCVIQPTGMFTSVLTFAQQLDLEASHESAFNYIIVRVKLLLTLLQSLYKYAFISGILYLQDKVQRLQFSSLCTCFKWLRGSSSQRSYSTFVEMSGRKLQKQTSSPPGGLIKLGKTFLLFVNLLSRFTH